MDWISVKEVADKWGVTPRRVQKLLSEGRIAGAEQLGGQWLIPANCKKPGDPRRRTDADNTLYPTLLTTYLRMESGHADVLPQQQHAAAERELRCELAYMRGDFAYAATAQRITRTDSPLYVTACNVSAIASISVGDYTGYRKAMDALKAIQRRYAEDCIERRIAELAILNVSVSLFAPQNLPSWFTDRRFDVLTPEMLPMALYLYTKYLHSQNKPEAMLAVAETALALRWREKGYTISEVYLLLMASQAAQLLNDPVRAQRHVEHAMELALPDGITTPFAENLVPSNGLIETSLLRVAPELQEKILLQSEQTWGNWISVHNELARDNVTLILTRREYQIASLARYGCSNAEIAERVKLSESSVKAILSGVYDKLFIKQRRELAHYIL